MKPLTNQIKDFYENSFDGTQWAYLPRVEASSYGLAIAVVGHRGKIEIPLNLCQAHSLPDIAAYAKKLNREKTMQEPEMEEFDLEDFAEEEMATLH